MQYPAWEYPFIFLWLSKYIKLWRFWEVRRRIKYTIKWRQEIGIIPKDRNPTLQQLMQFGHWGAGQEFIERW